ncbi:5-oxoprolinase subunit PxpB [Candidatus Deferrimicrobium sp.]|uniref:5-oxoprolinase subunit PxpB n=1 Tax=Candidatus Deferrimicrobium sp. TaxID=3060586 RepID=UPI002ECFDD51
MHKVRMLAAGEQGLVIEFGDAIDPAVNARVHRLAHAISLRPIEGILEWVPTYRSLLVLFDPLLVARGDLAAGIGRLLEGDEGGRESLPTGRIVELPVCYGGEFGPDLDFVARQNGISPEEAIAIHSSVLYLVYMLGFTPGFPYLGGMSSRLATPRLSSPRGKVPAGAVGIAGDQTGVYPVESPGGWRLIGRTPLRLFDPDREDSFLVAAGDFVRFLPIDEEEFWGYQQMEEIRTFERKGG